MIPNTNVACIILEDYGAMFYNTYLLETIGYLSLIDINEYYEQ